MFPQILKFFKIKTVNPAVSDFMISVVKENLKLREQSNVIRKDFFQLLIQLRNGGSVHLDDQWNTVIKADENQKTMTLNEICAQAFVFFAAGFETSSTTLSFLLYELAKNHEVQQRVHTEIVKVLENYDGQLTYEAITDMIYLEKCIDGMAVFLFVVIFCVSKSSLPFCRNVAKISRIADFK